MHPYTMEDHPNLKSFEDVYFTIEPFLVTRTINETYVDRRDDSIETMKCPTLITCETHLSPLIYKIISTYLDNFDKNDAERGGIQKWNLEKNAQNEPIGITIEFMFYIPPSRHYAFELRKWEEDHQLAVQEVTTPNNLSIKL